MSRSIILAASLVAALGFGSAALATSPPVANHAAATSGQTNPQPPKANRSAIKPGDRRCLRHTGSLIPPKRGECLNAVGTSYSAEDLQRTGEPDTARALQRLDPSIRVGH